MCLILKTCGYVFIWSVNDGGCFLKTHFQNVSKCVHCVYGGLGLFCGSEVILMCFCVNLCFPCCVMLLEGFFDNHFFSYYLMLVLLFMSILLRFLYSIPKFFHNRKNVAECNY